jgi:hypothetical protein
MPIKKWRNATRPRDSREPTDRHAENGNSFVVTHAFLSHQQQRRLLLVGQLGKGELEISQEKLFRAESFIAAQRTATVGLLSATVNPIRSS